MLTFYVAKKRRAHHLIVGSFLVYLRYPGKISLQLHRSYAANLNYVANAFSSISL